MFGWTNISNMLFWNEMCWIYGVSVPCCITAPKKCFARQSVAQLLTFLKTASANADEYMSCVLVDYCHRLSCILCSHIFIETTTTDTMRIKGDTWYERSLFWASTWSHTTEKNSCLIPFNAVLSHLTLLLKLYLYYHKQIVELQFIWIDGWMDDIRPYWSNLQLLKWG